MVGNVAEAVAAQSKALAGAADQVLAAEPVRPERFVPLSRPDAVLRYAGDFLPSWAGAISIDLLPAVLVLILVIVHGAIRREEDPEIADNVMTAADMIQAMRLYERMRREDIATDRLDAAPLPAVAAVPVEAPAPPAPPERVEAQNVRPLAGQRSRGESGST